MLVLIVSVACWVRRNACSRMPFFAATLFAATAVSAAESRIEVGFLAPDNEQNEFWGGMGRFAKAVAEDLNIELRIVYQSQGEMFEKDGRALVDGLSEDAYFITLYEDERSHRLLQAADARNIRSILINTDVLEKDREQVGKPRQKLRHWIGHMHPDDVQAGYEIADLLFQHFERPTAIQLIAINGHNYLQLDVDRRMGLQRRLTESPGATLHEVREGGGWHETTARAVTLDLLQKYPSVNAIWTASDTMALGAIAAVKEMGKQPGKDIVVAGVDWTSRGLEAVRSGELLGSVGGHFMEAGFALLLIYDYHHGHDFADDQGVSFKTPMVAMSQTEIRRYLEKVGPNPDWSRIDFKRLTKTHNTDLKRYDFSWARVIEQL
jgi:ABC-type sugar transport system substrate-binding protein